MKNLFLVFLVLGLLLASCGDPISSGQGTHSGYRVIYNVGDGFGPPPDDRVVAPGATIELPNQSAMISPSGREFSGWSTGGATYKPYARYVVNSNVDFTAQWTVPSANPFTVSFNKGEGGGTAPASFNVAAGTTIYLPSQQAMSAPGGKQFDGWTSGSVSYAAGVSYSVNASVVFTAKWVGNSGNPVNPGGNEGPPQAVPAGLEYSFDRGSAIISGCAASVTTLNIPAQIQGMPVTTIVDYAFWGRSNLSSVTIPSSVTLIGNYAFTGCSSLASVTLSRHTQFGRNVFPSSTQIIYSD